VTFDPQSNGSPPLPYAFSTDGGLLPFGVGLGESGRQAMLTRVTDPVSSPGSVGDDAVGGITDLLTGKGVVQFCKRGGGPPPAPGT
jgi:hypothetical protein